MKLESLRQKKLVRIATLIIFLFLIVSCTRKDRVAPIQLPESAENVVTLDNGLKMTARAFTENKPASDAFGFNIRRAGILPVQVTFQNDSQQRVTIVPDQTFLIDQKGLAWPILPLEQTYQRTRKYVEIGETAKGAAVPSVLGGAAGAVAGAAIGIVTGRNIGEAAGKGAAAGAAAGAIAGGAQSYGETGREIRQELRNKRLGNEAIQPNQLAYGVLFFPGTEEEAQSVSRLRLFLNVEGQTELITIDLDKTYAQ